MLRPDFDFPGGNHMHRRTRALFLILAAASSVLAGCGGSEGGIGEPADKAKATRVIEVRQFDQPKFEPALIVVKPSEIVTLRITNTGKRIHEFYLGSKDDQEDHAREMGGAGQPTNMPDRSNAVTVEPGQTEELTWQFPKQGSVQVGCHQPGDYASGMRAEVKVSE